jgi:hypothetical protein
MGSFETSDDHARRLHRPLRVAVLKGDVFSEVRDMVADLEGWTLLEADQRRLLVRARRKAGFLGRPAEVTITVEGPDGIPSATVNVCSRTEGGLLSRDKANVAEFMEPFSRRVG